MSTDTARRQRFERVAADVFEPLQRYLRRRASVDDASDVFGETMLTLWRRLDDVPADDPLPWSYGVARRCLANHRRSNDRRLRLVDRAVALRLPDGAGTEGGDPGDAVERGHPELLAAIDAELTDAEAEIVRLWAWEQLEPAEIAIVLATTANAVSVALGRARRKLRTHLEENSDAHRQDAGTAGQVPGEAPTEQERSER